ncbi:hypothetical protein [Mycolicibacterium sphagni]|uniref:Uncharacterized protein n=1 Tax=Mycolicibacterium sphagni TaxID=1786 RepID=A0A255DM53_9MYCO|nr:hypothetical protein [Mycolicibacterium sphagni]OYN80426.1 hypothetical protein CG716_09880 [Mycolicibacterium sphagni]
MLAGVPTDAELRATFKTVLADAIKGAGVPEGVGLDQHTTEALLDVDAAAPNPPASLIQAARVAFGKQLDKP